MLMTTPAIGALMRFILGQTPPPAAGGASWVDMDTLFWATVLAIFVLTLIGALIRARQRDKCLRLLHDHHITYLSVAGEPLWGDLHVSSSGLELRFDAPHTNRRGLVKTSTLVFKDELAGCLALCRTTHALTANERAQRQKQIDRSFHPGPIRRFRRGVRNLTNTLRDAISNSLSMFIGRIAKAGATGGAIRSQKGRIEKLSTTVIAMPGNAYEPLLERHIGKPVILELINPDHATPSRSEIPGYLVDYSDQFIAVFASQDHPLESLKLEACAGETLEREGVRIEASDREIIITCTGQDPIVVRRIKRANEEPADLAVVLTCGASLHLQVAPHEGIDDPENDNAVDNADGNSASDTERAAAPTTRLEIDRTRGIDIVCPRSRARVRFGSGDATTVMTPGTQRRKDWHGLAPSVDEKGKPKIAC